MTKDRLDRYDKEQLSTGGRDLKQLYVWRYLSHWPSRFQIRPRFDQYGYNKRSPWVSGTFHGVRGPCWALSYTGEGSSTNVWKLPKTWSVPSRDADRFRAAVRLPSHLDERRQHTTTSLANTSCRLQGTSIQNNIMSKPPFTQVTAQEKVKKAQDLWNAQ